MVILEAFKKLLKRGNIDYALFTQIFKILKNHAHIDIQWLKYILLFQFQLYHFIHIILIRKNILQSNNISFSTIIQNIIPSSLSLLKELRDAHKSQWSTFLFPSLPPSLLIPSRSKRQRIPLIRHSATRTTVNPGQDRNSFPMIPRIYPGLNRGSPKALSFQPYTHSIQHVRRIEFPGRDLEIGLWYTWMLPFRIHATFYATPEYLPQIITLCHRRSNGWTA